MNELSLSEPGGFAPNCLLIGEGQRADCVWTNQDFLLLCDIMLNGNGPNEFLITHQDKHGAPKFARAKTQRMKRRAGWSWDTITGRAKSKVGLGFYPSNAIEKSQWAAMDFDAHDGNDARARDLAADALNVVWKATDLYVILTRSGSGGWHLFLYDRFRRPRSE